MLYSVTKRQTRVQGFLSGVCGPTRIFYIIFMSDMRRMQSEGVLPIIVILIYVILYIFRQSGLRLTSTLICGKRTICADCSQKADILYVMSDGGRVMDPLA